MKPRSVRLRLTLWYSGIFAAIFVAYAAGIVVAMRASVHAAIDEELGTRLADLRTFMERHDPAVSMDEFQYEFREHSGLRPGGDLVQVSDPAGQLLFQSRSIRDYHVGPRATLSPPRYETVDASGGRLRVLSANITVAGRTYVARLAAPVADAYAMLQRFQWLIASSIPVVLALASAAGYWMSRRALAPVDEITGAARSIGEHNLSNRLRISRAGDELQRLAETTVVHGDAPALERLFVILIDNAVKYTLMGGHIRVMLQTSGNQAVVTIEDSGIGIPKDALPFVFDRFYRVDKVRSRQAGGAGLGLSIARWIVDAHHGSIEVESAPGKGTTFVVRIPVVAAVLEKAAEAMA